MGSQIRLGDIAVDVVLKDIRNVHLSVYPPNGRVRIAAPLRTKRDTIRVFAISKLGWIRQQQRRIRTQEREAQREVVTRESHYVWGKRFLLTVIEQDAAPTLELRHSRLVVRLRPGTSAAKRREILDAWYREQLKAAVLPLLARWEKVLGVRADRFFVQRMRTKWGSCSRSTRSIRLNTDLARKPRECLEYIVVHELLHLLEPSHGPRFVALMDRFLPQWRYRREQLNRLPVRHQDWEY